MICSPTLVPTFGDFSQDISRCKVRQDFIRFRFKIIKQMGEFQKNIKKDMKYWHQGRGKKNTTCSHRIPMRICSKWVGPAAPTHDWYPSIPGLGGPRWSQVNAGGRNDPPTPFDKPWLLPQTTLHAHARRTFCTSVCKPRLTPSN